MNDKELLEFLEEHCLNCCPCAEECSHDRYCFLCDINKKIIEIRSRISNRQKDLKERKNGTK